jgi:hypothetical protein
VYSFDPAVIQDCRFTLRGQKLSTGYYPEFPRGVRALCWQDGSSGEFIRTMMEGRPALGMASRGGQATAQVAIDVTGEAGGNLTPDGEYVARVEYLTRGGISGNLVAHNLKRNFQTLSNAGMADTGGTWLTSELRFRRPKDDGIQIAVDSPSVSANGMIYIGSIDIFEASEASSGDR